MKTNKLLSHYVSYTVVTGNDKATPPIITDSLDGVWVRGKRSQAIEIAKKLLIDCYGVTGKDFVICG